MTQNPIVTEFKDSHGTSLSLYFYPSTLRMINIERNPEFDEMIREIRQARFFRLDSGSVTKEDLRDLTNNLQAVGFEEMMLYRDGSSDVRVWGLEKKKPEMVIISNSGENEVMVLEIDGMVNVARIPRLAQTFNENAFFDIMNFNQKNN